MTQLNLKEMSKVIAGNDPTPVLQVPVVNPMVKDSSIT